MAPDRSAQMMFVPVMNEPSLYCSQQPGCIDKFHQNTEEIIDFVAAEAEAQGSFEDTVRLYDLAKV